MPTWWPPVSYGLDLATSVYIGRSWSWPHAWHWWALVTVFGLHVVARIAALLLGVW